MLIYVAFAVLLAAVMIFFSTLSLRPKHAETDAWIKVKLKRNYDVVASWCRVIPGQGVKFYTLDGDLINQEEERVAIVEPCLDSNVSHPIPRDEISDLFDGTIRDGWSFRANPFNRRN
jgi:hypothetical protein